MDYDETTEDIDPILGPEEITYADRVKDQEEENQKKLDTVRAYKSMFNSPEGRIVLKDMMKNCKLYSSTFSSNHAEASFREGRRTVVLDILKILEIEEIDVLKYFNQSEDDEENII